MSDLVTVTMPRYPDCWETCGSCGAGEVIVSEILVSPGDVVRADDNVVVIETGKTTLDIPTSHAGRVAEILVHTGDLLPEGAAILTLEPL